VLQLNGANDITIVANGTYSFPTLITSGTNYVVSIISQPINLSQTCALANENNTIGNVNVTNVDVSCLTNTFTVGGTIVALEGNGLVLLNNNGDATSVAAGTNTFTFGTAQPDGTSYDVSVLTQPSVPAQICTMTNNKGKVGGINVVSIEGCCKRVDSNLVVNENTVFDPTTKLTWQRDWEPNDYNWIQAVDRCAIQELRLPTQVELESIVDARFTPAWMSCTFRGEGLSAWTSTTVGNQSAFIVHFSAGETGNDVRQNRYAVRCVSGP